MRNLNQNFQYFMFSLLVASELLMVASVMSSSEARKGHQDLLVEVEEHNNCRHHKPQEAHSVDLLFVSFGSDLIAHLVVVRCCKFHYIFWRNRCLCQERGGRGDQEREWRLLRLKLIEKKKSMLMPRTWLESQPRRLKMMGSKAKVLMDHWLDPGSMISASGTMWNLRKHSGTNGSWNKIECERVYQ